MQEMFPEIYEIYDETCFRKLNDSDITAICKSYVNKVREIGGEFIDAGFKKSFLKNRTDDEKKRRYLLRSCRKVKIRLVRSIKRKSDDRKGYW